MDAVFEPTAGGAVLPTELALGPWDPGHLHGGPVAALLGRAVEQVAAAEGLTGHVARFAVDLPRPVPREEMRATARVVKAGRRAQRLEATIAVGEEVVCQAAALLVSPPPALVAGAPLPDDRLAGPEGLATEALEGREWRNFLSAVEFRPAAGRFEQPGPATYWMRVTAPLVAGEATSPLVTVLALSDFANGISRALDFETALFINPEVTTYLHRLPVSAWVALASTTWMAGGESAYTDTALYDERGRIGRAAQAMVIAER